MNTWISKKTADGKIIYLNLDNIVRIETDELDIKFYCINDKYTKFVFETPEETEKYLKNLRDAIKPQKMNPKGNNIFYEEYIPNKK